MLEDIHDGTRDAVIVWHLDRLYRRPIELEEFVRTCTAAGVVNVVTLHGNLGSGDGLLLARLLSAVAANESDSKARPDLSMSASSRRAVSTREDHHHVLTHRIP
jgi:site-specific DNA recombinase